MGKHLVIPLRKKQQAVSRRLPAQVGGQAAGSWQIYVSGNSKK